MEVKFLVHAAFTHDKNIAVDGGNAVGDDSRRTGNANHMLSQWAAIRPIYPCISQYGRLRCEPSGGRDKPDMHIRLSRTFHVLGG